MKKIIILLCIINSACASPKSLVLDGESYQIYKEIDKDITNDGLDDKVFVLQKNENSNALVLIQKQDEKNLYTNLLATKEIIPFSPLSRLEYEIMVERSDNIYEVKDEGMTFTISDRKTNELVLHIYQNQAQSLEENQTQDFYRLSFLYDGHSKAFTLNKVYAINFDTQCDHSLISVYWLKSKEFINKNLGKINVLTFKKIFDDPKWINLKNKGIKIISKEFSHQYKQIKKSNISKQRLKNEVEGLLSYSGMDKCSPRYYINEKYFFEDDVSISNNIAFYFQKAGFNEESITLLETIVAKYPNRTVAYLNLADAYYADNNPESAKKNYLIYESQMKEKNQSDKIHQRIYKKLTD